MVNVAGEEVSIMYQSTCYTNLTKLIFNETYLKNI